VVGEGDVGPRRVRVVPVAFQRLVAGRVVLHHLDRTLGVDHLDDAALAVGGRPRRASLGIVPGHPVGGIVVNGGLCRGGGLAGHLGQGLRREPAERIVGEGGHAFERVLLLGRQAAHVVARGGYAAPGVTDLGQVAVHVVAEAGRVAARIRGRAVVAIGQEGVSGGVGGGHAGVVADGDPFLGQVALRVVGEGGDRAV